jgi:N,N'-diacetylchitobiose transport system permease protein
LPRSRPSSTATPTFRRGFEQQEFGRYFLNSPVVAGGMVIVSALIAFLAAVTVTRFRFRFRFRFRTNLLIMFLVAHTVPGEALTIPLSFRGFVKAVLAQRRLVSGLGGAVKD